MLKNKRIALFSDGALPDDDYFYDLRTYFNMSDYYAELFYDIEGAIENSSNLINNSYDLLFMNPFPSSESAEFVPEKFKQFYGGKISSDMWGFAECFIKEIRKGVNKQMPIIIHNVYSKPSEPSQELVKKVEHHLFAEVFFAPNMWDVEEAAQFIEDYLNKE